MQEIKVTFADPLHLREQRQLVFLDRASNRSEICFFLRLKADHEQRVEGKKERSTYRNFLALNDIEDLSPKRDPVRASLTPLGVVSLGRSSAHDFRLDENGSGGIGEDIPRVSQAKCCNRKIDEPTLPPAGNRKSGAGRGLQSPPGARRLLCWGGRAAPAEKVAGASRAP